MFVRHSITLSKKADAFVNRLAKKEAKRRGQSEPNFSAALSDLVVAAHKRDVEKRAKKLDAEPVEASA